MASRRQAAATTATRSAASQAPKPPCSIHPSAIISDKAIITGTHPVTIGEGCVIHPFAKITSAIAPVRLGNNCIVAERSVVGLVSESSNYEGAAVTLEDNVSIETGAVVEAASIGAGTVVEVSARVSSRTVVGKVRKTGVGVIYSLHEQETELRPNVCSFAKSHLCVMFLASSRTTRSSTAKAQGVLTKLSKAEQT